MAIRGFRWSFPDDVAAALAEGLVLKAEVVLRIEELCSFSDGTRWVASVLEVRRAAE